MVPLRATVVSGSSLVNVGLVASWQLALTRCGGLQALAPEVLFIPALL